MKKKKKSIVVILFKNSLSLLDVQRRPYLFETGFVETVVDCLLIAIHKNESALITELSNTIIAITKLCIC